MEPKRRRELVLAALVVVLGAGVYVAIEGWPFGHVRDVRRTAAGV